MESEWKAGIAKIRGNKRGKKMSSGHSVSNHLMENRDRDFTSGSIDPPCPRDTTEITMARLREV